MEGLANQGQELHVNIHWLLHHANDISTKHPLHDRQQPVRFPGFCGLGRGQLPQGAAGLVGNEPGQCCARSSDEHHYLKPCC